MEDELNKKKIKEHYYDIAQSNSKNKHCFKKRHK